MHQTLSANHAGKMFDACEEQISGDMTQNIGRHDYKFRATWLWFRATWLRARWLSGDLTVNPCTAPGKCCSHWLYRSSWINRLRSWPVQLCSLVWWPVHLVVRLLSHSPSIWCIDNIARPSTKNQSECIYLGQYRPKLIFRNGVYVYQIVACESIRFSSALVSSAEKNGGREATTGNTSAVRRLVKLFHEISNFELHVVQWGKL